MSVGERGVHHSWSSRSHARHSENNAYHRPRRDRKIHIVLGNRRKTGEGQGRTCYPKPTAEELERLRPGATDVSALNLAAIWSTYRALGHSRLIMSGVIMHPGFDRRWILAAIPDAEITLVRLQASEATLAERLERRELGSGTEEQLQRTLRQARRMAAESGDGLLRVPTDGKTPAELADTVLRETGWLA